MNSFIFGMLGVSFLIIPAVASAHGTDYRVLDDAPAVSAEFFYADGVPMCYAEVLIFSPDNEKVEYQNGRTDQAGRFAFVPSVPGSWKIQVSDGMGHAVHTAVDVKRKESSAEGAPASSPNFADFRHLSHAAPLWIRAGLGLSALVNIFFFLYLWKGGAGKRSRT